MLPQRPPQSSEPNSQKQSVLNPTPSPNPGSSKHTEVADGTWVPQRPAAASWLCHLGLGDPEQLLPPLRLSVLISSALVLENNRGFILWARQGLWFISGCPGRPMPTQLGLFGLNGMPWLFRICK